MRRWEFGVGFLLSDIGLPARSLDTAGWLGPVSLADRARALSSALMSRMPNARCAHWTRAARIVLVSIALSTTRLLAQDSTASRGTPWMVGGSIGVVGFGTNVASELTTVSIHFTQMQPDRLGLEFSIGTIPRLLLEGLFVVVVARPGVVLPIELAPGVLILPSAGATLVGALGSGGAGSVVGYNVGGAAVFGAASTGFRVGLTWHQLQTPGSGLWLLELGIVNLPKRDD